MPATDNATKYQMIEIDKIIVKPDRKRKVGLDISNEENEESKQYDAKFNQLKDSIKELGLMNPITVTKTMNLIAGGHRLEACKQLGHDKIPAIVMSTDDLHAELLEIDENLIRINLSALQEAEQLARRKVIYEQLNPSSTLSAINSKNASRKTKRNNFVSDKTNKANKEAKCFTQDTSEKTGKTQRTIEQSLQIAKNITDEAKEKIEDTYLENNKSKLLEIARVPQEEQSEYVETLLKEKSNKKSKNKNNIKESQNNEIEVAEIIEEIKEINKKEQNLVYLDTSYRIDLKNELIAIKNKWQAIPPEWILKINKLLDDIEEEISLPLENVS